MEEGESFADGPVKKTKIQQVKDKIKALCKRSQLSEALILLRRCVFEVPRIPSVS